MRGMPYTVVEDDIRKVEFHIEEKINIISYVFSSFQQLLNQYVLIFYKVVVQIDQMVMVMHILKRLMKLKKQ